MSDWKIKYSIYAAMIYMKIIRKIIEISYNHFWEYTITVKDLKH